MTVEKGVKRSLRVWQEEELVQMGSHSVLVVVACEEVLAVWLQRQVLVAPSVKVTNVKVKSEASAQLVLLEAVSEASHALVGWVLWSLALVCWVVVAGHYLEVLACLGPQVV